MKLLLTNPCSLKDNDTGLENTTGHEVNYDRTPALNIQEARNLIQEKMLLADNFIKRSNNKAMTKVEGTIESRFVTN